MISPMVGEVSYLWSWLIAKCELRQLLDELCTPRLESFDPREAAEFLGTEASKHRIALPRSYVTERLRLPFSAVP